MATLARQQAGGEHSALGAGQDEQVPSFCVNSCPLDLTRKSLAVVATRPPSPRQVEDTELAKALAELYAGSRRTYGVPRIHAQLTEAGWHCGRKRVA